MKKIIGILLISALGGTLTLGAYKILFEKPQVVLENKFDGESEAIQTNFSRSTVSSIENTDFTIVAEQTLNTVVHVKNTSYKTVRDPYAEFFYGQGKGTKKHPQVGTGSGVIISANGYIITNNHVVKGASEIEVTFNNKKVLKAEIIGTDPTNDIALLKVEEDNLPFITFGDSNSLKVGEWVLAVGNPYNLTSTVTAGIVSAKARDLRGNSGVDSFIQTDAAVNSGNSGGALVNTNGELVGINTAISSRTGSFIGYSFAVPSNIAKKVIEDLMEFGNVQTAILGVRGGELNSKAAADLKIEHTEGFYISEVTSDSGAEKAGLKQNDIIVKLDNVKISTFADLTGYIRTKRPNDVVQVYYLRDGKEKNTMVTLIKNEITVLSKFGLELKNMKPSELVNLPVKNGVKVVGISNKELLYYGVKKGYVIVAINGTDVNTVDEVNMMLEENSGGDVIRLEMLNLDGELERYIFR